jgi:hypothetical protein
MVIMGGQLYNRVVGTGGAWTPRYVQIAVPSLDTAPSPYGDPQIYAPVTPADAFPTLGVVVQGTQAQDSVYIVQLSSTFPNHDHFERRLPGGTWQSVQNNDVLPVGQCRVEYRSVDGVGNTGASGALDVWIPRAPGFIESGVPGGVRAQARYCS